MFLSLEKPEEKFTRKCSLSSDAAFLAQKLQTFSSLLHGIDREDGGAGLSNCCTRNVAEVPAASEEVVEGGGFWTRSPAGLRPRTFVLKALAALWGFHAQLQPCSPATGVGAAESPRCRRTPGACLHLAVAPRMEQENPDSRAPPGDRQDALGILLSVSSPGDGCHAAGFHP